jgi:hypothetical protein
MSVDLQVEFEWYRFVVDPETGFVSIRDLEGIEIWEADSYEEAIAFMSVADD